MEIGPLSNRRPLPTPVDNRSEGQPAVKNETELKDTVEISDDARTRLAQLADAALRAARDGSRQPSDQVSTKGEGVESTIPTQERIERIRERIESGFYDQPDVKGKIADRLIDDLDL